MMQIKAHSGGSCRRAGWTPPPPRLRRRMTLTRTRRKKKRRRKSKLPAKWRHTLLAARERLIPAVVLAESRKKLGHHPPAPPFEIINHPGRSSSSFVRQSFRESMGMGYHTAVQCVARTFSRYKEYLVDYYNRNQKKPNAAADLTGDDDSLTALANKCAEMEGHLMFLFKFRAGVFAENVEIKINRTSDKITKRARETTNALESEFPAAAVAFKCITKEAELMSNAAGKLISDKSDVKTCSGKDVLKNDILDDWIMISPKKVETVG
uniref:Uncharacterized protein n=1 Tax=Oryza glumipatula TaxID=40148 RepID=A0A0D9Z6F0_9ORYZ